METFDPKELKKLYQPKIDSSKGDNGMVTIIGGSSLFHGAPLLSLKVASRIVDMVFFATPEPSVGEVATLIKSKLFSFIWVPWDEVGIYVQKSDSILIGPGLMRYRKEQKNEGTKKLKNNYYDEFGEKSKEITRYFLTKYSDKKWVIDAGSLQVMDVGWIPQGALLTPNRKEFSLLFGSQPPQELAKRHRCFIIYKGINKGPTTLVCSPEECEEVKGGNPGMAKGGMGDILAGLAVSFLAKNEPFLAATAASYIAKAAADELYKKVGINYNADDLAEEIPSVLSKLTAGK